LRNGAELRHRRAFALPAVATVERISHAPAMHCHALLLAAAVSSLGPVHAQAWSITATAPFVGSASATITSNFMPPVTVTGTLPIGPVAPGIFFVNGASLSGTGGSGSASSRTEWTPSVPGQLAPLAFLVKTSSGVGGNVAPGPYNVVSTTSIGAVIRMSLQAPQPTTGRLAVRYRGVRCDFGNASISFDIGANGSVELMCISQHGCGAPWEADNLPLVIPATGTLVEILFHSDCGANALLGHHGASMTVEAQFFPGQAVVDEFAVTGASADLGWEHRLDDTVFLTPGCPYPTCFAAASLVVFGVQPMTVPITPTLVQLVSIDAVAAAPFAALMPPMPPGSLLYCQGLVLDTTGALRGTRSMRAFWP
jgi:hypothetical protein